jgi:hypothetical protein
MLLSVPCAFYSPIKPLANSSNKTLFLFYLKSLRGKPLDAEDAATNAPSLALSWRPRKPPEAPSKFKEDAMQVKGTYLTSVTFPLTRQFPLLLRINKRKSMISLSCCCFKGCHHHTP